MQNFMKLIYLLQLEYLGKLSAQNCRKKGKKKKKKQGNLRFFFYKHIKLNNKNENARSMQLKTY